MLLLVRQYMPGLRLLPAILYLTLPFQSHPCLGQDLIWKEYSTHDGLPDSRVAPLLQDSKGYLWMGTHAGLTRYDGEEFVTFGSSVEIPGIFGRDLLEDHTGAVWFAHSGSSKGTIVRVRNRQVQVLSKVDGLSGTNAFGLAEDTAGTVWVVTSGGIDRIGLIGDSGKIGTIAHFSDSLASGVFCDRSGRILLPLASGLYAVDHDSLRMVYKPPGGQKGWHVRSSAIYQDRRGRIWIGGYLQVLLLEETGIRRFGKEDGIPLRGVWCFCEDIDGTLWLGTMEGLYRASPASAGWKFEKASSFGDGVVYDMLFDREGNLWLATSPGLRRVTASGLRVAFKGMETLSLPGIGPIRGGTDGSIYFGSRAMGLYILAKGRVMRETRFGVFATRTITDILVQDDGEILLGLWNGGIVGGRHGRFTVLTAVEGLPAENIHSLAASADGSVFVGTSSGMCGLDSARRVFSLRNPSLDSLMIFDIRPVHGRAGARNQPDTLWLATNDGVRLVEYDRARLTAVWVPPAARFLRGRSVFEIMPDGHGRTWCATDGAGLVMLDGMEATVFSRDSGLAADRVFALAKDSVGNIWAGTSAGLSCFDGASFMTFRSEAGFGEIGIHGLYADREGFLWVSAFPGVAKLRPRRFSRSTPAPPVYITNVRLESQELDVDEPARLDHDHGVLMFRFAGLSFSDEASVMYRTRLAGFEENWSRPSPSNEARYTHLPSGTYTFQVIARSGGAVWSAAPAEYVFHVLPPLWARWWFITISLAFLGASAYALHRYRVATLLKLEQMRGRIAMDLHDDIGSSLTRISVMTEVAQRELSESPPTSSDTIRSIGESAREMVDALGDIVWAVDPKHDNVHDVIRRVVQFGQEVCEPRGIAFETELAGSFDHVRIDLQKRKDIFLLFKEAIHNVVRHSGANHVRFTARFDGTVTRISVLDDGAGMPQPDTGEGHGLRTMRERAARIGGDLEIRDQNGRGTSVTLTLKTG